MGKFDDIIFEELIDPEPDRYANRIRVHRSGEEVTIHFRNLKIVLHDQEEINEWKNGFAEALKKI